MGLFHYEVAKYICQAIHDFLMNRYPYLVGFRWNGGGARILAEYLKWDEKGRRFFCMDISQKDVAFTAMDIAILLQECRWCYQQDESFEAAVLDVMMDWLVSNTAYHVVNWPGGFRFVVGILFSGDYNTSFLNTLHLVLVCCCYCVRVFRTTGEVKYLTAIRDGAFTPGIQGDDIIGSMASEKKYPKMSPDGFRTYLLDWNMRVKPEAYRTSLSLFSQFNSAGQLVSPEVSSIIFLHRYFVWQDGNIRPQRPLEDFVLRLYHSTGDVLTPYDTIAKITGLALDTMGVNERAWILCYSIVEKMLHNEMNAFPSNSEGDVASCFPESVVGKRLMEKLSSEKFVQERLYKSGLMELHPMEFFSLSRDRKAMLDYLDGRVKSRDTEYMQRQGVEERPLYAGFSEH